MVDERKCDGKVDPPGKVADSSTNPEEATRASMRPAVRLCQHTGGNAPRARREEKSPTTRVRGQFNFVAQSRTDSSVRTQTAEPARSNPETGTKKDCMRCRCRLSSFDLPVEGKDDALTKPNKTLRRRHAIPEHL